MAPASETILVKPGDSLIAARDKARAWHRDHPGKLVTVSLEPGSYILDRTLVLTAEDSHTLWQGGDGVTSNAGDVIISGGVRLTDIRVEPDGTWRAPLGEGPLGEQLFVDAAWAEIARWPDPDDAEPMLALARLDHDTDAEGLARNAVLHLAADPAGRLPSGGFTVAVMKDWALFRQRVAAADGTALTLASPTYFCPVDEPKAHNHMVLPPRLQGFRLWAEGHPDFISRPGEWAVDAERRELVYKPRPGDDPARTRLAVPRLRQLVRIEGTAAAPVVELLFTNLTWCETADPLPATGHDGGQAATVYGPQPREDYEPQAAIEATFWHRGTLLRCRITAIGGHGLALGAGCREVGVRGCLVTDLGGNGVMFGVKRDSDNEAEHVASVQVADCLVQRAGRTWAGAVGIWQGFANDSLIAHNRVRDLPYTGISAGWRWSIEPSSARNNRIIGNHISDVMRLLGDGGGIYTLGHQPDSEVAGNLIHDIHRSAYSHGSPNNGIYPDQGSSGIDYHDNVVFATAGTPIRFHGLGGLDVKARNNILVPTDDQAAGLVTPPYPAIYFRQAGETVDPRVAWSDNTILTPADWQARSGELLDGRHFGPRGPYRAELGLEQ